VFLCLRVCERVGVCVVVRRVCFFGMCGCVCVLGILWQLFVWCGLLCIFVVFCVCVCVCVCVLFFG